MPVPPRTWSPGDPVSPTYLNSDLYLFNYASPFYPTGVLFHGRRPLYKAAANTTLTIASGSWQYPFQGQGSAFVLEDSPGDFGNHLDPPMWGTIQSTLPGADGSAADTGGGWFLLSAFTPVGNAGSNFVTFAADLAVNGANSSGGQYADAASGQPGIPWTADLVNMASAVVTAYAYNGDSATRNMLTTTTGDGVATRFQGHWAAAASGTLPGTYPPAPRQSWSATDQWPSQWANENAGIRDILGFWNRPPVLRAVGTVATSLPNQTGTPIALGSVSLDTWSAYSTSTNTWTCPADGLYLIIGRVCVTTHSMFTQAGVSINGTSYWGPSSHCNGTLNATAMKAQVFSLLAGDTVQLLGYQASGGTLNTSVTAGGQSRLIIVHLTGQGVPGVPVNPNPYFAAGSLTGWDGNAGTLAINASPPAGCPYPYAVLLTPGGTAHFVTADEKTGPFTTTPSAWYGLSALIYATGSSEIYFGFEWTNSGTPVSTTTTTVPAVPGQWVLIHAILQAPSSGINEGFIRIGRENGSGVPATDTLVIAGAQAAQVGSQQPPPPNLAWRYQAGTPAADVPTVLTDHLAADLGFLAWRPYLLAHQTITQAISNATAAQVTMNDVAGMVHGDYGDNYGGWNATDSWYVAQQPGWYLCVAEVFADVPSGATAPMVQAQFQVSPSPGADSYEYHTVTASTSDGTIPGATAIGYYYLREGDYIYPLIYTFNYPSSDTYVTAGHQSHMEVVFISE